MTRHLYRCPLRWADMDQLGHVNNVTYVDYLQEARVDMLRVHPPAAGGEALAEGVVVVRHEVEYVAPLVFRMEPVNIELWVTEVRAATFTLAYEIFDESDAGRRVYLRARSVLTPYVFDGEHPRRVQPQEKEVLSRFLEPAPPLPATVPVEQVTRDRRHTYDCVIRFSDVDAYRHVNNVKYFEYYQEARIAYTAAMSSGPSSDGPDGVVVAKIDVDYRAPLFFREEPYAVDSWVSRVGSSSFVVDGEIRDGDTVLSRARVVLVAFDPRTGRSVPLTQPQKDRLRAL